MFNREIEFESVLVETLLKEKGWQEVINNPTEQDLINNWAKILYENNRDIDRLNNQPLTNGEMAQILEQINTLKTPLRLNGFINGKSVSIVRDNPDDTLHFGKEVSLKIYDRMEIAEGQSRYQIARQPKFTTRSKVLSDRRGDLLLLINGMPVFHIELKKSGIPISQATNQIEFYAKNGIFSGLFSLVQIFVAMTPEDCLYFANPGQDSKFNPDYFFRWANFNNEPITDWKSIASVFLSIPMAHQLIGFYTVADTAAGILKVMRSYQYWAVHRITDRLEKMRWEEKNQLGGYIWHTTGSGKTMTSFKSAQLIANSKEADKVVFLVDRIELGTQSLDEYNSFAEASEEVQSTENTTVLVGKLKSTNPSDTLIVTSIQKLSNIKNEEDGLNSKDIEIMNNKRIVFIVDEAHRSTFGDMLITIKNTFPRAVFFGFTGTPIHPENQRKGNTTEDVFGGELHRYSIADGIRDKNVLGFHLVKMPTFQDKDVRRVVALEKAKAIDEADAFNDPKKKKIYLKYINDVAMAGHKDIATGKYVKGIEDYLANVQYSSDTDHQNIVVSDILGNWVTLSQNSKFHAIMATHSIYEAIEYYRLLKEKAPNLRVTALFDPNVDFDDKPDLAKFKEDGLAEVIEDYNNRYFGGTTKFKVATHAGFKKDVAARLAHKEQYRAIEHLAPEKQLDLLIVVDQMLTGFDSKWINTLYMDKVMEYANIIQAFSRTNRLFGPDKPFGTIRYYRRPHTMEANINKAVKSYSGDKPLALFVSKLGENIEKMDRIFEEISAVFASEGISNFSKLPDDITAVAKFATLFKDLTACLEAARIQGFNWEQTEYPLKLDEQTYKVLALRYKDLASTSGDSGGSDDLPYDIVGHLTEIDTGHINSDYMNSRFDKFLKTLDSGDGASRTDALNDLHNSFSTLTADEQKYANIFLRDIQAGDVTIEDSKTLRDYITEYQLGAKNAQVMQVVAEFGIDEKLLREFMKLHITEASINELGRFDNLVATVDKAKAKAYFEKKEGVTISAFATHSRIDKLLRSFIIKGGFDLFEADQGGAENG